MALGIKRQAQKASVASLEMPDRPATEPENTFDHSFLAQIRELAASGLTPSSALELIGRLIAETLAAPKEAMDRIKVVDKLLNTARAMLETRLKNEEAAAIAARLDEMELVIEKLAVQKAAQPGTVKEVWDDSGPDGGEGKLKESQDSA
jgi:hypothetical protein